MIVRKRSTTGTTEPGAPGPARHARPAIATPFVAPRNPTEARVAEIWAALLRIEAVGVHDGFFDLGGDSLLAIQLLSRLRKGVGTGLQLRHVFELGTVARLAEVLDRQATGAAGMEQLLTEIEGLSDDEVRRRLDAEPPTTAGDGDDRGGGDASGGAT